MPDAKHDNKLWKLCKWTDCGMLLLCFIGVGTVVVLTHGKPWAAQAWTWGVLLIVALLMWLLHLLMPRLLTFRCRRHVAHPCPYCGRQPNSRYGYQCPIKDPISASDIKEWNRETETVTDFLDSDHVCQYCGGRIIVQGDWTDDELIEYTAKCDCAEASSRQPGDALRTRQTHAAVRSIRRRQMNEPDVISAMLNGESTEEK